MQVPGLASAERGVFLAEPRAAHQSLRLCEHWLLLIACWRRPRHSEVVVTDSRSIAYDATFMILFIGLSAAMAVLSLMLLALLALDIEFGPLQVRAAMANLAGWAVLPLAPRIYARIVGHPFSWRANGALGGEI